MGLAQGAAAETLQYWLKAQAFDPQQKVQAVTGIYNELDIRQLTETKMNGFFDKGLQCLDNIALPQSRKKPLRDFVAQLINRES